MAENPIEEEAQRVFEALGAVEEMTDPLARARAIGQLLKDQAERNKRFMEYRRQVVLDLRAQKVPYRKIAAELGVSLGTVQDIERGAGRWSSRPKPKTKESHEQQPE
ncbi:helix-turn-helix domain-containing protein [Streptomyces jumonjinensis]|uniref:Helix-turn-helix domain-containing protein n=1 Tax=Streptomyces jumonjinensis TaxID=1945 RepID=A0A646KM53_STRJU|nr:helix-turn-helix domain-containing protein [Streptomyces jumonjinensis]MQT03148.1 helix-turn-helix domain-containing protein [Streptomyces jumonjinensis]